MKLKLSFSLCLVSIFACGDSSPDVDAGDLSDAQTDAPPTDAPTDGGSDAGTDAGPEPCSDEGAMRTAACGMCGMGQELCEGGTWVPQRVCLNEGECLPGSLEMEDLAMCAQRARLCNDTCNWGPFDETREPGECEPGDRRAGDMECADPGEVGFEECTDSCEWSAAETCESACGTLRSGVMDEEELCVPGGLFFRGEDDDNNGWSPEVEIFVSTFAIDRFPVTNDRLRRCVTAGGCTPPSNTSARAEYDDLAQGAHPARPSWDEAAAFCEWDGGRRLPTDAEWQKAARGPSPRRNTYAMGDVHSCEARWLRRCPGEGECGGPIAVHPAADSHYGLSEMGYQKEWVIDVADIDFLRSEESRVPNPVSTDGLEGAHVVHGGCNLNESRVGDADTSADFSAHSLRCVRVVEGAL